MTRSHFALVAFTSFCASALGCLSNTEDVADAADNLSSGPPSKFVLAPAADPTCVATAAVNVPLGMGDCAQSAEFTFDAASRTIRSVGDPAMCLDVQYASKAVGANVILHPCHGRSNQSWRISKQLAGATYLAPAIQVEAFADDGASNLCLSAGGGVLTLDTCSLEDHKGWVLDQRIGQRLVQRGKEITSLLTFGMLERVDSATQQAEKSDRLPPEVGGLAVELVKRVMPPVGGEPPRVLVVLDNSNAGENPGDAARIAAALKDLLTRTRARLDVDVRAGVEITTTKIQAVIESEIGAIDATIVQRRDIRHFLVSVTLVCTITHAVVELTDEPAGGLHFEHLRMTDGKPPHTVWFSNPGHPIDDAASVNTLLRFAQRGGGVIVQGDDTAQGAEPLTGLRLRESWDVANGHVYCGNDWDNGTGKYPVVSKELPINGMIYTDDLDLVMIVDARARVLAVSNPSCNGKLDELPAIIFIDADRNR
ncbi:MAG TPA: RICIN domain-containing protein [Labilithrix sp.]|nr:RICIN domain-containing protein [Labilithrix sp.]